MLTPSVRRVSWCRVDERRPCRWPGASVSCAGVRDGGQEVRSRRAWTYRPEPGLAFVPHDAPQTSQPLRPARSSGVAVWTQVSEPGSSARACRGAAARAGVRGRRRAAQAVVKPASAPRSPARRRRTGRSRSSPSSTRVKRRLRARAVILPGAARSTLVRPQFEKPASRSVRVRGRDADDVRRAGTGTGSSGGPAAVEVPGRCCRRRSRTASSGCAAIASLQALRALASRRARR